MKYITLNKFLKFASLFLTKKLRYASVLLLISSLFFVISVKNVIADANATPSSNDYNCSKTLNYAFQFSKDFEKFSPPISKFNDEYGKEYVLKAFKGKSIFIYYWASWCNKCIEDLKALDRLQAHLIQNDITDLVILPISIDFLDLAEVKKTKNLLDLKNLVLFTDKNKELYMQLRVSNLPTSYIIDENFNVVYGFQGSLNFDCFEIYSKIKEIH